MNSEYLQSYIYVFFPSFLWILMQISQSSSQIISSNTKNNENSDSKEIGTVHKLYTFHCPKIKTEIPY